MKTSACSNLADAVARRALEENLWWLWSRFGRGDGCVLHEESDALWFDTPIPTLPYNAVIRFAVEHDVDRRIDALFAHYRKRGVPFLWMVHPGARPLDLAERLCARGMEGAHRPVAGNGGLGIHVRLDMGGAAHFGPYVTWVDDIDYRFDETRRDSFVAAPHGRYTVRAFRRVDGL